MKKPPPLLGEKPGNLNFFSIPISTIMAFVLPLKSGTTFASDVHLKTEVLRSVVEPLGYALLI